MYELGKKKNGEVSRNNSTSLRFRTQTLENNKLRESGENEVGGEERKRERNRSLGTGKELKGKLKAMGKLKRQNTQG